MKKLGVIGGMGPLATAHFMTMVVEMTDAACDTEHVPMIIYNQPDIPDRTRFLMGQSQDSPLPALLQASRSLEALGVDLFVMPCVTAHALLPELVARSTRPFLDLVAETARHLSHKGVQKAGLMTTEGTRQAGFFSQALSKHGICVVLPSEPAQKHLSRQIYANIKAGLPIEADAFASVEQDLRKQGADVIVLGCTDLSIFAGSQPADSSLLDVARLGAALAITHCQAPLKAAYKHFVM